MVAGNLLGVMLVVINYFSGLSGSESPGQLQKCEHELWKPDSRV